MTTNKFIKDNQIIGKTIKSLDFHHSTSQIVMIFSDETYTVFESYGEHETETEVDFGFPISNPLALKRLGLE